MGYVLTIMAVFIILLGWMTIVSVEQQYNAPCSTFESWTTKDVPVRCFKELTR